MSHPCLSLSETLPVSVGLPRWRCCIFIPCLFVFVFVIVPERQRRSVSARFCSLGYCTSSYPADAVRHRPLPAGSLGMCAGQRTSRDGMYPYLSQCFLSVHVYSIFSLSHLSSSLKAPAGCEELHRNLVSEVSTS